MRDLGRSFLRLFSPRHRRWYRLLDSLTLAPERLEKPVTEPGTHDFVICGPSRTGTTLLAAMLFQPPRVVTVMEPWDGMRMPPADLFASLREEIRESGTLARGKLDLQALEERRVAWWKEGRSHRVDVDEDFFLGVKWPAYWQYLDLLPSTRFLACVRHPYDTIASFKAKGGRLAEGFDYDIPFNSGLNESQREATSDPATRRAMLYEHATRAIVAHREDHRVLLVPYEDWFTRPAEVIDDLGEFLGVRLGSLPVDIRPPQASKELDEHDRQVVREHCPSAVALGYEL